MAGRIDTNGSSHEQPAQTPTEASPEEATARSPVPDLDDFSPKQRETLRAIADHPEATQR